MVSLHHDVELSPTNTSTSIAGKPVNPAKGVDTAGSEIELDLYVKQPSLGTVGEPLRSPLSAEDEYADAVRHNGSYTGLGFSPASDLVAHRLEHVLFQGVRVVSSVPSLLAHADF